uniref:Uncharacterized protein n=1 Tax=Glossina palpalis gambiensis TaxID=67801 RepID=A0A1B0BIH7_9MUSC
MDNTTTRGHLCMLSFAKACCVIVFPTLTENRRWRRPIKRHEINSQAIHGISEKYKVSDTERALKMINNFLKIEKARRSCNRTATIQIKVSQRDAVRKAKVIAYERGLTDTKSFNDCNNYSWTFDLRKNKVILFYFLVYSFMVELFLRNFLTENKKRQHKVIANYP